MIIADNALTAAPKKANLRDLMDRETRELLLSKHEAMLAQQAWRAVQAYGVPFEEAQSEAHWSFMKACDTFDDARGAEFGAFLHLRTGWDLKRWIMNRSKEPACVPIDEDVATFAPETRSDSLEALAALSPNARALVDFILNPPHSVAVKGPTGKQLLRAAKDFLFWERSLNKNQIRAAHNEAKNFFRSLWQ